MGGRALSSRRQRRRRRQWKLTVVVLVSSTAFAGAARGEIGAVPLPLDGAEALVEQASDVVAGPLAAIEPATAPVANVLAPVTEAVAAVTEPAAAIGEGEDQIPQATEPAVGGDDAGPPQAAEPASSVVEPARPEAGQAAEAVSEPMTSSTAAVAETPIEDTDAVPPPSVAFVDAPPIEIAPGPASVDESPGPTIGLAAPPPGQASVPISGGDPAAFVATADGARSLEPSATRGATPDGLEPVALERIDRPDESRLDSRLQSIGLPGRTVDAVVLALLGVGLFLVAAGTLPRRAYAHVASVHAVDARVKLAAVGAAVLLGAAAGYFVN